MARDPDVFISYSSDDLKDAETVCRVLELKGIRCWIASRDIPGGRHWDNAIVDGINASSLVVLIHTSNANGSDQIKKELHLAHEVQKIVIPLRVEKVHAEGELKYVLAGIQWVDAFEKPLEDQLEPLIERVREDLQASHPQPSAETAPRPAKSLRIALLYRRNVQPDDHVLALLESGLRDAGHHVFVDRHLPVGIDWADEIKRQVKESDAIIPLLSRESVKSEMLAGELEDASRSAQQNAGKPRIFPVRITYEKGLTPEEQALPEPFFSILGRLQYQPWESKADDLELLSRLLQSLVAREQLKIVPEQEPGGAEALDSPYYIEREADSKFREALDRRDSIVCVKGARQMGKTSLLARGMQYARGEGKRVVFCDFQSFQSNLADIDSLFRGICGMAADQLDLSVYPEEAWRAALGSNQNFERYFRQNVLGSSKDHLVLAMDEVDLLTEYPFASQFFGLFRSWHNKRATDPAGPWSRITLAIVYATEAHLLITDQNQSPFNVGTQLKLEDLTLQQVDELNQCYQAPLRTGSELERFYALFNGQPYLTRRGFFDLTHEKKSLPELEAHADADDGPYGDHLKRILFKLAGNEPLKDVLRGLLRGKPIPDAMTFYRLRSAGLVAGESTQDAHFRCAIYRKFLARHLG